MVFASRHSAKIVGEVFACLATKPRSARPQAPLDWPALCRLEPRLRTLESKVARIRREDWHGWERLNRELQTLVGWSACNPALASSAAYELAIAVLLDAWEGHP